MAGSRLQEVFELTYTTKSVVHMLSGKAIPRAVQAHFIVDALNAILLSFAMKIPLFSTLEHYYNFPGKREVHTEYDTKKYGQAIVVFDSYYMTHQSLYLEQLYHIHNLTQNTHLDKQDQ